MKPFTTILFIFITNVCLCAQPVIRKLEPCACPVTIDSSFSTQCAYLVVPENRRKENGKMIKLPFIVVHSKNPAKRNDPLLYTTGGPGGSSLGWARGAAQSQFLNRDCIAFEQRGTYFALPRLDGRELSDVIKESYRRNLDKDSMMLVGVKRYKKALLAKGIDLSGYNTDETVADIDDLLATLKIDSVNLMGGSYSGGLMLAVLQKDPGRVRSLYLDSPLPTFVPIDEDEPANLNEALSIMFRHVDEDSANKALYAGLKQRFQAYFTAIGRRPFTIRYLEKDAKDSITVQYNRNDLLNIIEDGMGSIGSIKDLPYVITELIAGRHEPYIKRSLDYIFSSNTIGPNGMRISVYCADQTAYHREEVLHELKNVYPWMEGYHINDVYREICDCWAVPPIAKRTKQPYYSNVPILLADGEMDYACRPIYIDMIRHYMPNAYRILVTNRSHMVGSRNMERILWSFLDDPYQKPESGTKEIIVY